MKLDIHTTIFYKAILHQVSHTCTVFFLFFSSSVWCKQKQKETCPSVSAIQTVFLSEPWAPPAFTRVFITALSMALVCPAAKTRNDTYKWVETPKKKKKKVIGTMQDCTEFHVNCPAVAEHKDGGCAVLSAGGAQHTPRWWRVGRGAVVGEVVVGLGAGEDGVPVGGGAAELEPPQVLSVHRFVTLQHFDGLIHGEPFPFATCRGRQRSKHEFRHQYPWNTKQSASHKIQLMFLTVLWLGNMQKNNQEVICFNNSNMWPSCYQYYIWHSTPTKTIQVHFTAVYECTYDQMYLIFII